MEFSRASPVGHKLIIHMVPQSKTHGKSSLDDPNYIKNCNFILDLVILISTVRVAISKWGAR